MKKMLLIGLLSGFLYACGNQQLFDTTFTFTYAEIKLPSGEIVKGSVSSWKDFSDGDMVQIVIDGKTYLTHAQNVVLMSEE